MRLWLGSDYGNCTDKELIIEYDAITNEVLKRFGKRKLKKK